jgi:hypothetical protein
MTTQFKTLLPLEQMPYGYQFGLDLMALPGKLFAAIGRFIDTLDEAIDLRNRYLELNGLDQADLARLGITRQTISQAVAEEAGLFDAPAANNSNDEGYRPAA